MIRDGELRCIAPGSPCRALLSVLGGPVRDMSVNPILLVFDHAIAAAAMGLGARVVMIGDSPEHDVAGARAMGLSTLLVRTGIHRDLAEPQLLRLCEGCGGIPDFLTGAFEW